MEAIDPFEYDIAAGQITFGRGTIADLGETLADLGAERALVVCGTNVSANRELMAPVEDSLGDTVRVFDETTPAKDAVTAFDGVEVMERERANALVAVGGGSSIDLARAMRAIHADGRSYEEIRAHVADAGVLPVPDSDFVPLVAIPTTLAGAELSTGGSITFYGNSDSDTKENGNGNGNGNGEQGVLSAGYSSARLVPDALIYDPDLFETTPTDALVGSAMNGFDKGIELPYSRHANPFTDATAARGLALLRPSLPRLPDTDDSSVMDAVVAGIILVQFGRATRGPGLLSLIHAFGHGLREHGVQQGIAHAVMAPSALEYLFTESDGRREFLADALGVDNAADPATAVVNAVKNVRDGLGLPTQLRELDPIEHEALPDIARVIHEDRFLENGPEEVDPDIEDLETVLENAW